jgi:hypothetical protein
MRVLLLAVALEIFATPAHAKFNTWIQALNRGGDDIDAIAERMERNDYIRFHENVWKPVARSAGTTPPTALEREYVYFLATYKYLNVSQSQDATDESREKMNVYMRKLQTLPDLHAFSKYLIARVLELQGYGLPSWMDMPKNAKRWYFFTNAHDGILHIDDVSKEYLAEKEHSAIGSVLHTTCFLFVVCWSGISGDEEHVIEALKHPFGVEVFDNSGSEIKLSQR